MEEGFPQVSIQPVPWYDGEMSNIEGERSLTEVFPDLITARLINVSLSVSPEMFTVTRNRLGWHSLSIPRSKMD